MRKRRRLRAAVGRAIQAAVVLGFVCAIGLAFYVPLRLDPPKDVPDTIFKISIFVIAGLGFFSLIYIAAVRRLLDLGSRFLAVGAQELLDQDQRPPVLYLRSFAADRKISFAERVLAEMLAKLGPVVAIGRPDEIVPRLGAARLYVPEADWQRTVSLLLERSRLVLLVAGRTPGLNWEIQECRRLVPPDKLIVVVPNDADGFRIFADLLGTVVESQIGFCFVEPRLAFKPSRHRHFLADSGLISFDDVFSPFMINGLISFDKHWQPKLHPVQITAQEFHAGRDDAYGGPVTGFQQRLMLALRRAIGQESSSDAAPSPMPRIARRSSLSRRCHWIPRSR